MGMTKAQRQLLEVLQDISIDELVVGLRLTLCDFHCRILAAGLICPVESRCDSHIHDVDSEFSSVDIAEAFMREWMTNEREH